MKTTIPIHGFQSDSGSLEFEVMPWRKDLSKYDATEPHRHDYYEVLIFLKGGGKHEIDFHNYPIRGSSLHFISSNQVHEVKRSLKSDGFSLLFTEQFIGTEYTAPSFRFYQTGAVPVLNLTANQFREIKFLLKEIQREYFDASPSDRKILKSLLLTFLLKTDRLYQATGDTSVKERQGNEFTREFKALVEQHFQEHWRAADYAGALHISPAQLNNLCKQHFSKTTEAYIQGRLLIETKRLLSYTDNSIKEICFNLGFEDPAYFTRFFKKKTGATPAEYRNMVK